MTKLTLEFVGYHWPFAGDLFYMEHEDGRHARFFVDSVGNSCVDITVVPEGGFFPSERVDFRRALNGAVSAAKTLQEEGFKRTRWAFGNACEKPGFGL